MGIVKKQSIYGTLLSYIGVVVGFVNIAYLFPRFFEPEQLGLRSVLVEFSMLFAQVSFLGFNGVITKYFPYFRNEEKKHNGFLFIVSTIPFVGFTLFVFIFLFFKAELLGIYRDKSPLILEYYYLIFPIAFFMLYTNILDAYIRSFLKVIFSNFVKEILIRLLLLAILILFAFHLLSIHQFWYLFAASYAMAFFVLLIYIQRLNQIHIKPDFNFLSPDLFKGMMSFGFFSLFSGAANLVVLKIDSFMLSGMMGLNETGVYALAVYIATIIETPKRSLNQIADPLLSQAWKINDLAKVDELYKKSALNLLIIGGALFLLLWLNIDQLFEFIPKKEIYIQGKWVIFFIGLAKLFDMATGMNGEIISYSKHYRFGLYSIIILALITIGMNYLLIPLYGLLGAAIATAFSVFIYNIIKYIYLYVMYKLQPFNWHTGLIILTGLAAYFLVFYLPKPGNPFLSIVFSSTVASIVFFAPILALNLSPEINDTLKKVWSLLVKEKKK
ncbi:MAG: oligosaccharide flippase family protein [Cytophagaceae bacterium]